MAEPFSYAIETLQIELMKHRDAAREAHRQMNISPNGHSSDAEGEETAIAAELENAIRVLQSHTHLLTPNQPDEVSF